MRGVVDLVFKESDGWVIVDYKTDDREDRNLAQLKEVYRPQLELYAKIWEEAAGEAVKEIGLHFVRTNQYTRLN
jgi:ATP-dependent helicase/nuclease subunit A